MAQPLAKTWTDAPELAIPEPPAIFYGSSDLWVAYETTAAPRGEICAIVRFRHVIDHRLSPINDEGIGQHLYARAGLKWYTFNELIGSTETVRWQGLNARHWVVTFKDNTLDVVAESAEVISSSVFGADPASVLVTELANQSAKRNGSGQLSESEIDRLTGLPNRQGFQQRLVVEYERAKSLHLPLSLLALDVDHFDEINRLYLHSGGDQVLAELASMISSAARPGAVVVRDGGDQFSLLLPGNDGDEACREAERIRLAVASATVKVSGVPVPLTVSVGVATATFEEAEAWELFVRARNAVHCSKDSGRNRVAMA